MSRSSSRHPRRGPRPTLLESLETRCLMSAAPIGYVDVYSRSTIAGWAYDATDGASPIAIDIEINGAVTTITANASRGDLVAVVGSRYHGFTFTMPTLDPGAQTVNIYARSSDGTRTLLRAGTLTNPPPVGYVDSIRATGISGWVVDPDATSQALQIRVDVDGVTGTPQAAGNTRTDLVPLYGSANHGFTVAGNFIGHVVDVYAQDNPSGKWVLLKSTNHPAIGYVDHMTMSTVSGWAFDADLGSAAVQVRVDIDGVTGTPTAASMARGDLTGVVGSPNHGFRISLPALAPGAHTISVYAIDAGSTSAAPVLIGQGTVTNQPPRGYVDRLNSNMVSGWAFDPDAGASPINVTVYVDNAVFQTVSANQYRGDLAGVLGSGSHAFSVDLSSLPVASHSITVTMHDSSGSSQDEIVLFDGFINNHPPIGYVDAASSSTVSGWAYDPDAGASPINVDVYIDGTFALTASANGTRNDLTTVLGSPNHAFKITLPAISFGTHTITVYAAESQGNVSTLIGSRTIVHSLPTGYVDRFNSTSISGWAFDSDAGTSPVMVQLFVDGVATSTITANGTRNDLTAVLGSPNHAFTFTVSSLTPGTHELSVFVVDPNNSQIVPLATRTITV